MNAYYGRRAWTAVDDEKLEKLTEEGKLCTEIGHILGRTVSSIAGRARLLGISIADRARHLSVSTRTPWSADEIAKLRELFSTHEFYDIQMAISGRTREAIILKAKELSLTRDRGNMLKGRGVGWDDADVQRLKELWATGMKTTAIAKEMNRTAPSVVTKAARIGLKGAKGPGGQRPVDSTSTRLCMCCRRGFESEGIHNRLCQPCKDAA